MVEASELHGSFVLSSGRTSNVYFDKFRFLTRADLLRDVAHEVAGLLAPGTALLGRLHTDFETMDEIRPARADVRAKNVRTVTFVMHAYGQRSGGIGNRRHRSDNVDRQAPDRWQKHVEVRACHQFRKHASSLLEQGMTEDTLIDVKTSSHAGQIPDWLNGGLGDHDITTGKQLWKHDRPSHSNADANCSQSFPLSGDRVLVSKSYGVGGALLQIKKDGENLAAEPIWESHRVLKTKFTNAAVIDNFAYALSDGVLECVDLETGKQKWRGRRSDRAADCPLIRARQNTKRAAS